MGGGSGFFVEWFHSFNDLVTGFPYSETLNPETLTQTVKPKLWTLNPRFRDSTVNLLNARQHNHARGCIGMVYVSVANAASPSQLPAQHRDLVVWGAGI